MVTIVPLTVLVESEADTKSSYKHTGETSLFGWKITVVNQIFIFFMVKAIVCMTLNSLRRYRFITITWNICVETLAQLEATHTLYVFVHSKDHGLQRKLTYV